MDDLQTGSPASNPHQSNLLKASRRSTFLARPLDQSEPVYENPNNTPERNHELLNEYEHLQVLNRTLGTVSDNLEKTKLQFYEFNDTIDKTNGLLDMWLEILKGTENIKSLVENPEWRGASSMEKDKTDHNKKRRLNG